MKTREIPLRVLVVDRASASTRLLLDSLEAAASVVHASHAQDLTDARDQTVRNDINTIFIDPLSLGVERASTFVFELRETLPGVVFVLYQDQERVQQNREEFFRGERRRFSHYYRLDKRTPADSFEYELAATLRLCQSDLSWGMRPDRLARLLERAGEGLGEQASRLEQVADVMPRPFHEENTVFVSHRFSDADAELVEGLTKFLVDKGFKVTTGRLATGYISQAVLQRIREAEFFLSLLTHEEEKVDGTYTTSAWLHQELGAAIAFDKPLVLMVEEGITDFGGLQGDTQRIPFSERGFMKAALDAAEVLNTYAGR